METADGGDVAGYRADGQVLVATSAGLFDHPAGKHPADALIPAAPATTTGSTSPLVPRSGNPVRPTPIERIPADAPVVLRQLGPQGPAGAVVAFGVVADDDLRRG
jgi:hypothetical protein